MTMTHYHKAVVGHCNASSRSDPLSLFTPDDRDVQGMDSHMCPHDCGQEKTQQCCEMEPSSC